MILVNFSLVHPVEIYRCVLHMLERGSRRQELRDAMTCFVFASRTVRLAEEIKKENDSQAEEGEENEEEEAEERKERRDRGQSSSHGVRSTERLIFFHPFSFQPPVPPVGPSVSLSSSIFVEKVIACLLFISLPVFRPFSTPIVPHKTPRLFSWIPAPSPASRACTRPFFCRIFSPFRCHTLWRGGGAVFTRYSYRWRKRSSERRNYSERKVVRLMKSQFNGFTIRRFCRGSHRAGETAEGEECVSLWRARRGRRNGIYTRYALIDRESKMAEFHR